MNEEPQVPSPTAPSPERNPFPSAGKRRPDAKEASPRPERDFGERALDRKLDAALEQTFPASDAFWVT